MKITGNEPASPKIASEILDNNLVNIYSSNGLTIRQHFAAMAMQGLLACPEPDPNNPLSLKEFAAAAVKCADALIAELNRE
jgi:hypothetical protein